MSQFRLMAVLLALTLAIASQQSLSEETSLPPPTAESVNPFTGLYKDFSNCRQQYEEMDARVEAAGVRSAAYFKVPGFPYLRTDRALASFRKQIDGLYNVAEWVRRMRELDEEARYYEYVNLGFDTQEIGYWRYRFLNCGRILAWIELQEAGVWETLVESVNPAEDQRPVEDEPGVFRVITNWIERAFRIDEERSTVPFDPSLMSDGVIWRVKPVEDLTVLDSLAKTLLVNQLGYPGLVDSQWRALAEIHAPTLAFKKSESMMAPSSLEWHQEQLVANTNNPAVYYLFSFARFGTSVLPQITYTILMPDHLQGDSVRGIVWRVTLDEKFMPMTYETASASGSEHRWYPVQSLKLLEGAPLNISPHQKDLAPDSGPVLWVDHLRVAAVTETASVEQRELPHFFVLRPYEDLYTLPVDEKSALSSFDSSGFLRRAQSADSPVSGRMSRKNLDATVRQAGHQLIQKNDPLFFDDPRILEKFFVVGASNVAPRN